MGNQKHWCFAWFAGKPVDGARGALQNSAKWAVGDVINVAFLEGDDNLKQKVKTVAQEWIDECGANLTLSFISDIDAADIRIAFRLGDGSWSTVGTTCRQVPAPEPTMNYGWLDETTPDDELRRVVLHEFGHALGLLHEHQNPSEDGKICWNRENVIRDLSGPPNNWPLEVIEFNIFQPADVNDTNFTAFDKESIMMYPIPAHWTCDGSSVDLNSELSAQDRKFIADSYR